MTEAVFVPRKSIPLEFWTKALRKQSPNSVSTGKEKVQVAGNFKCIFLVNLDSPMKLIRTPRELRVVRGIIVTTDLVQCRKLTRWKSQSYSHLNICLFPNRCSPLSASCLQSQQTWWIIHRVNSEVCRIKDEICLFTRINEARCMRLVDISSQHSIHLYAPISSIIQWQCDSMINCIEWHYRETQKASVLVCSKLCSVY